MKSKKIIFSAALIVVMLLSLIPVSAASGSSYISVSSSSVNVGDTLTVTVTVSADNIFGFQGSLSYNSSVIQFVSSDTANGSSGNLTILADTESEGQSSTSSTIIFRAIAEGNSAISFSVIEASTWDDGPDSDISVSGASTSVTVSGSTATPRVEGDTYDDEDYEYDEAEEKEEEKKVEDVKVTINGVEYTMLQDLEGVELPDGYGPYVFTYNEKEYTGAVDSTGRIIIAYMKNEVAEKSGFFVFDEYDEQFAPYVPVKASAANYVLYRLEKDVKVPSIFDIEVDNFGTGGIPAWESSDKRLENYVLFYGISPSGEKGFYIYDKETSAVQKFLAINFEEPEEVETVEEVEEEDFSQASQSLYRKIVSDPEIFTIVAIISALAVALLIALILCIFFKKNKRVNKEKFDKKMSRKQKRIEKKTGKYVQSGEAPKADIEIDTENFDEMTDTAEISVDEIINEENNTEE